LACPAVRAVTLGFALDSLLIVPSGVLMDRRGRKLTGVPAFLLLAAGVALIPAAHSPSGLAAVGALLGCGNGLSAGISGTLAADFSPPAPDTGAFLGLWRLVADAGSMVGPVAAGALARRTNLGVAARCVGLFGAAGAAWLALVVPETGSGGAARAGRIAAAAAAAAPTTKAPPRRSGARGYDGAKGGGGGGWARAIRSARRALAARLRGGAAAARRADGLRLLNV
jgi:MFS family permease